MKRSMTLLIAVVWSIAAICEIAALLTVANDAGMGQRLFIGVLLVFSLANAGAYTFILVKRPDGKPTA